jgi:uncharacterized membrane protein
MRVLRWLGMILMPLAVVTGLAMCYMRYIVNSTPIYQGPVLNGGSMMGGYTTDQNTANVFAVNIIICVLFFGAGLGAFIIGNALQKKPKRSRESRGLRS